MFRGYTDLNTIRLRSSAPNLLNTICTTVWGIMDIFFYFQTLCCGSPTEQILWPYHHPWKTYSAFFTLFCGGEILFQMTFFFRYPVSATLNKKGGIFQHFFLFVAGVSLIFSSSLQLLWHQEKQKNTLSCFCRNYKYIMEYTDMSVLQVASATALIARLFLLLDYTHLLCYWLLYRFTPPTG